MANSIQQQAVDIIATQILFDAKAALVTLKKFNDVVTDSQTKVRALKDIITATAAQMNGDLKGATASVQKFANSFTGINPQLVRSVGKELQDAGEKGKGAGDKIQGAFEKTFTTVNATRIALGALISMILFQAIQAVGDFFRTSIEEAKKFEDTLYRIANVERQLSKEGVEITIKGLRKGGRTLKDIFPMFSEEEIAELIGNIAITTKELGYAEDEMLKLAAASLILNINSTEAETALQTQAKIANSLVSPQAKSVGNLGLAFGQAKIEAKAFEMQLLETGESFKDLTEREKQDIKFQIVLETAGIDEADKIEDIQKLIQETGGDLEALGNYLNSNSVKVQENRAAWDDLKVAFGQALLPFIPALTGMLEGIVSGINGGKVALVEFLTFLGVWAVTWKQIFSGNIKSLDDLTKTIKESADILRTDLVNTFFKEVPEDAPEWFMRGWGDKITGNAETATGAIDDMYSAAEDNGDAEKALDDLDGKIQDIILDAKQAQEDLDLKLEQKQDDLDLEYERKGEDAARDHAQKLEDINQDALDKIEDAKRKAREDEKKAEQDLLQKLKELRQRFLLDLEDALRARDARQVLRLIKEYQLDKQNILDKKRLDDKERADRLAADLAAIETERQRRIESENIEYARKLADLNAAKAREQEDLAIWYKREQEDIQRNIEQKLQALIAGYAQEYGLHAENQQKIYELLVSYFGKDSAVVKNLMDFMAQASANMVALATQAANLRLPSSMSGAPAPYWQLAANAPVSNYGLDTGLSQYQGVGGYHGFAEGGTLIARKPTLAMFGEKTPEMVTFSPIGRTGKDANKVFGDITGGETGGNLGLRISISDGLIAEIVESSMENVAVVIDHARRER